MGFYMWSFRILLRFREIFFFKQKTAYEVRISDWSSDVCSSDLRLRVRTQPLVEPEVVVIAHRKLVGEPFVAELMVHQRIPAVRRLGIIVGIAVERLVLEPRKRHADDAHQIGRASCRDSVCQYV